MLNEEQILKKVNALPVFTGQEKKEILGFIWFSKNKSVVVPSNEIRAVLNKMVKYNIISFKAGKRGVDYYGGVAVSQIVKVLV